MKLSVVIPAYNEEKYIADCLQSLIEIAGDELYEIIVVDNNSTDKTNAIARSFKGVTVVKEKRKGTSFARQKGFQIAKGDLIAFIDADTLVTQGWIQKVKEEFFTDKHLVCLSSPYTFYDLSRAKRILVWSYWNILAYPVYVLLLRYMVLGANFVVRRKALEKIGGFDDDFVFYGDDTDIARRLHTVGKVKFVRRALVSSSGRRLQKEGMVKTGTKYAASFVWDVIFHRPLSKQFRDWR